MSIANKIKVAYVESSTGFGGSAKCVYNFMSNLNDAQFEGFVFCYKAIGWYGKIKNNIIETNLWHEYTVSNNKLINYAIKTASILKIFLNSLQYLRLFLKHRIDIVHTNNNIYRHIPAMFAAKILSIPVICHIHEQTEPTFVEKLFISYAAKYFVLSSEAKKLYEQFIPTEKIHVIRNGINVDEYVFNKLSDVDIKHPAVGVVGRLIEWKGQDTLIKSVPHILKKIPDAMFYIIGDDKESDGSFKKKLLELVRNMGLTNSVVFTGWINDPRSVMCNLDVLVCSSRTPEPFGLVLIESMLLGVPVISSNHGGPLDIITDGVDGLFFEPGDEVSLSSKITLLLENSELRKEMAIKARKMAEVAYSMVTVMAEIQNEYLNLLPLKKGSNAREITH